MKIPRDLPYAPDAAELVAFRNRLLLTQPQAAELLGVHPLTVSKWERGKAFPTFHQWAILRAMATTPEPSKIRKVLHAEGAIPALAVLLRHTIKP